MIRHIKPDVEEEARDAYFVELLSLAMEQTQESHGPFRLERAPIRMTQSRAMREMRHGRHVDVVWTMTSRDNESGWLPVRVPLLRGLLGVRVPVVAAEHVNRMEAVTDLSELRRFVAAQGHDWPDTGILRANDVRVETSSDYEALFRMVAGGRVDFLPRGVIEVWAEEQIYRRYDLAPGNGPLIAYPAPIYFFVAPENHALAERLEAGLLKALDDGSFLSLFESHPANRLAISRFLETDRAVIWLDNPNLTEETPTDEADFWVERVFEQLSNAP
ncbi:hypothetical protein [Natronospira sp.]|uniref:hypothetical protein n=1 Tax=Natronospira sp. TaxID=2024970 RepID=UPI003872C0CD